MIEISVDIGGRQLILQTGNLAKQANGSVFACYEGVSILSTTCCSSKINEDLDFIPLQVEYNEKYYAAGKIPGGFIKREGRPKDKEILVSRLIDRPLRPLFHKDFKREIQVIPTTVSADQKNPADVIAICAASASVAISDVPFDGPVAGVRVVHNDAQGFIVNPSFDEIHDSNLEIVVAGTSEGITMVEGGASEVSEEMFLEAIEFAHSYITLICAKQQELASLVGREKLGLVHVPSFPLETEIIQFAENDMEKACFVKGKLERNNAIKEVIHTTQTHFEDKLEEGGEKKLLATIDELEQKIVRNSILKKKYRSDGRKPEDIRAISCQVDVLPRTHGSSLFTRGETQALAVVTLGTALDEQIFDDIDGDRRESFMLHYNFPPYSVGEVGRLGTGRREVGHGHLAHRSLLSMMPSKKQFPYTVRVVSEILESNGSSSMATVCAGSLSLMQAGVPLESAIAGIAMGLVKEGDDFVVLSDILGEEDHLGDMDFKVAGTKKGITGFQMDIKIKNLSPEIMKKALLQAKDGRMHILDIMNKTMEKSSEELSEYAPRIVNFTVNPEQIGVLIGSGGKTIKGINEKFKVQTDISDSGVVTIYSQNAKNAEQAKSSFLKLLEEPEIPEYKSKEAAGADLFAVIDGPILIQPFMRILVPTGTYLEIPKDYEGQIRARSGLALEHGITVLNTIGTIDADYRGEIKVLLVNVSNEECSIQPMQRIAQLVIAPIARVEFSKVNAISQLAKSEREDKGYGSSGLF
ncbi:polyribonucleotide nucleotidyltransferase-like [Ylistrum balloti]|uniref:polyribonucleotide nucleotidyltransferase-like n=1 Tax=Ylistrum balloti TaxID=509963 RepID=UPI002905C0B1|nr:polyribonucleotide nucleotidyltransferase-like [Ylistrum balloti]